MKKQVLFNNLFSNPSYLGDDKLWAGSDKLSREDIIYDNEYDGI